MSNVVPLFPPRWFKHSGPELAHGASDVWGLYIFAKRPVVHFYVAKVKAHESLCGVAVPRRIANGQNALFGPGNFPKCKRCMDLLRPGAR